jgi:hypothetical protein
VCWERTYDTSHLLFGGHRGRVRDRRFRATGAGSGLVARARSRNAREAPAQNSFQVQATAFSADLEAECVRLEQEKA